VNGAIPQWTTGDRLRKAREQTGLGRSDFADELGVSRNTVMNYESGRTQRHARIVLRAWALRTGVPFEWLRTGDAPPGPIIPGGPGGQNSTVVTPAPAVPLPIAA
jgi:transcriptional regulator with XRE-family HTH domain